MRKDMHNPENPDTARPGWRTILGGTVVLLLLVILGYVGYQILHLLNPPNTYETVLTATVEDKVEAEGVVLFQETLIPGSGDLGYLAEDGARVSAGTVVAEVYTSSGQSALRAALDSLNEQIGLLQRAENVSTTQVDTMIQERTTALYDLLDAVDRGDPAALDAGREDYLLAQNKILVVTGEDAGFASRIAALQAEAAQLQSQLGAPAQIAAPLTGYFVRSASTRQLTRPAGDILAMDAASLKAALDAGLDAPLTGCAGKMVSGFSWSYCGVCTAEEGQKLLQADGTPLDREVQIRFPGQTDQALPVQLTEVTIDEGAGLARFVLTCDSVTGEVLRLGQAEAEVIVSRTTGLRVPAAAVHYVLETPEASSGEAAPSGTVEGSAAAGENYVPGVYVKFGNLAHFCRIDPVDSDHPLVTDGAYIIVPPKGTDGSVSEVRLYDQVIVEGQNLYDGKLLS